jgi:hypothetical protein
MRLTGPYRGTAGPEKCLTSGRGIGALPVIVQCKNAKTVTSLSEFGGRRAIFRKFMRSAAKIS